MELEKYIDKIKQCQNKEIKLQSFSYSHPVPKNLKGYMIKGKFYTVNEFASLNSKLDLKTGS